MVMGSKVLSVLLCGLYLPLSAYASNGLNEFASPLEKIVNTFTGPTGMLLSTLAFCGVAVALFFSQRTLDGIIKDVVNVSLVICMLAFASSFIGSLFTFSAAIA